LTRVAETKRPCCNLIVLTGGEPFRQNILPLVESLLSQNLFVQIETNGTLWVELPEDPRLFIVCSPKTPALNAKLASRITCYKYVLSKDHADSLDGLPNASTQQAEQSARIARPHPGADVYIMPLDEFSQEKNKANADYCVDIAKNFGYKLTLQTHKILGIR
jgi:organic radical activating enzyme